LETSGLSFPERQCSWKIFAAAPYDESASVPRYGMSLAASGDFASRTNSDSTLRVESAFLYWA
jgi:hypothetical protein